MGIIDFVDYFDINKYSSFFHDGSIIDIAQEGKNINISMQSAEMHEEDLQDNITLSRYYRIKGVLHLEGVTSIKDGDFYISEPLRMLCDGACILHFEIIQSKVHLHLLWGNYPPNAEASTYSFLEIEAEKAWWENIPDLYDPFW